MTHSYGFRRHTRSKYSKGFRAHGMPNTSTYLTTYKRGDFVTIMVDPAIHKGMPYHFYHGRTARVFNVTRRAVGVQMAKVVGNREILKRFHVRIEHVRKSRCQEDLKNRIKESSRLREEAKANGVKITIKRQPTMPKAGKMVIVDDKTIIENLEVKPFTEHFV
jgi:large subunit ribosomal protein L21e